MTLAFSTSLNADIIGATLPGTGVAIGPVTNICDTLNCPFSATDLEPGYTMPAQASFSGSWTDTDTNPTAGETLTATGSATVGVLKDSVEVSEISGTSPVTEIYGDAASFVEDTLTINDPSLNGTQGSLVPGMSIDGTGSDSGASYNAGFSVYAGTPVDGLPPAAFFEFANGSVSASYTGTAVQFTYGQPFGVELYFEALAGAFCTDPTTCSTWTGPSGALVADGSDTAVLSSLAAYDSNGDLVSSADWTATSGSGADYTAQGIVPEPSHTTLLVMTILMLGFVRSLGVHKKSLQSGWRQTLRHNLRDIR